MTSLPTACRLRAGCAALLALALALAVAAGITAAPASARPHPPRHLTATPTAGGISLTWERAARRHSVWRRTGSGGWRRIAVTRRTSHLDRRVRAGRVYRYRVRAKTKRRRSRPSRAARARMSAQPRPPAPGQPPAPASPPASPDLPPAAGAPASWVWSGDFDTADTSQYHELLTPTQGRRVSFVTAPALHGSAVKMELRPGDTAGRNPAYPNSAASDGLNRNQFRGIAGPGGKKLWTRGDDVYFRFAVNVDPSTTIGPPISNPWRVLAAFPSVEDGRFSPLKIGLQREANGGASPGGTDALVVNGDLGRAGEDDLTQWRLQNPQKGAWYEFVVHIRFSESAADGIWEFWLKQPGQSGFVKQTFNAGALDGRTAARLPTLSGATHRSNLRLGIYRNAAFTTADTIYYDDVRWTASPPG